MTDQLTHPAEPDAKVAVLIPLACRAEVVRQLRAGAHGDVDVARCADVIEVLGPAAGTTRVNTHVCIRIPQPLANRCADAIGLGWKEGRQLFREDRR